MNAKPIKLKTRSDGISKMVAEQMNCQKCNDSTKYVMGMWDGENGTHGKIYDCYSSKCEVKMNRVIAENMSNAEKDKVIEINHANGIYMPLIKAKRKELRITINKMALKLRIMCSEYSDYEMRRKPLPLELHERIDEVFASEAKSQRIKEKDVFELLQGMNELMVGGITNER